ncbi:chemosensory receptor b [Plakobranchus ocellatus]|uniref:Chemosensory receptor b n=1 Tax=Plakobranchus ocellatus TaxID=259542 RepID=A0AAV3ZLB0_9GAST|nr:chemosensory receptor b [Plakobranchus ocellatus]
MSAQEGEKKWEVIKGRKTEGVARHRGGLVSCLDQLKPSISKEEKTLLSLRTLNFITQFKTMYSNNFSILPENVSAIYPEQVLVVCVVCANATFHGNELYFGPNNWILWAQDVGSMTLEECTAGNFDYVDYEVDDEEKGGQIISDSLRKLFETLNFSVISGTISIVGSVANIINIAVFCRQKFADSVNISLLGLAISDFGALITLVWMSICFSPLFQSLDLSFDPVKVQYLTAGWPHVCFARITSYITAYVTLERCLCVTVPLKVKTIITPARTTITICLIFVVLFASLAPVYFGIQLGPVNSTTVTFYSNRSSSNLSPCYPNSLVLPPNGSNVGIYSKFEIRLICTLFSFSTGMATAIGGFVDDDNNTIDSAMCTIGYVKKVNTTSSIISLVYTHNGAELENISFSIGVFAQISSFVCVIICTVILVRKLAQTSRWRARSAAPSDTSELSGSTMTQRDKRLVKMVTFLSTIFIICFLPSAVNLIIMICSSEYSIVGRYSNMFQVGWSFLNCLEATNSSVNILVYYRMSSRYRKCFREMFGLPDKENQYLTNNNGDRSVSRTT